MTVGSKSPREQESTHHGGDEPALMELFANDLFRKPVPTFRDHALATHTEGHDALGIAASDAQPGNADFAAEASG